MTGSPPYRTSIDLPSVEDVRCEMRARIGESFDGSWRSACSSVEVSPDVETLDVDRLESLLVSLAEESPACHVMALSQRIRLRAARELHAVGR